MPGLKIVHLNTAVVCAIAPAPMIHAAVICNLCLQPTLTQSLVQKSNICISPVCIPSSCMVSSVKADWNDVDAKNLHPPYYTFDLSYEKLLGFCWVFYFNLFSFISCS